MSDVKFPSSTRSVQLPRAGKETGTPANNNEIHSPLIVQGEILEQATRSTDVRCGYVTVPLPPNLAQLLELRHIMMKRYLPTPKEMCRPNYKPPQGESVTSSDLQSCSEEDTGIVELPCNNNHSSTTNTSIGNESLITHNMLTSVMTCGDNGLRDATSPDLSASAANSPEEEGSIDNISII